MNRTQRSTIYTKATVYQQVNGTMVTLDGGVTLRTDVVDHANSTPDEIGFTVLSSKTSELYYSNQWVLAPTANAWKTVTQVINLPGSCLTIN